MLVNWRILFVLVALGAGTASAQNSIPNVYPDPGAGPVRVGPTPCLLAIRTHREPPCREPQVATNASKGEQVSSHLARAHYFIDIQQLESALAETKAARAVAPDSAEAAHLAARLALSLRDFDSAEADVKTARHLAPDDADIAASAAFILEIKQAPLEALRAFEAILKGHPDHRFALEQHAALLTKLHRAHKALADYDRLMKISPPDVNLLQARAQAYLAVNRPKDAVVDLSAAHAIAPNRIDLMIALAEAQVAFGDFNSAVKQYDALLETSGSTPIYPMLDNDRAKLLMARANALVKLKRFDDAAHDAAAAVKLGGRRAVLRAQIELRRNGFPELALDGENSPTLSKALTLCFGFEICFQAIQHAI
jgi:tetratricopeptide (TPR) repeat protein